MRFWRPDDQHAIAIDTITLLDEGWDNVVYLVNKKLIFRFPRRAFGVFCMEIDDETITVLLFHAFCCSISFLSYAYEQNKESFKHWAALVLNRALHDLMLHKTLH